MVSELGLDDPGRRARHAALLPRDVRDARPARRALRDHLRAPAAADLGRGAARARGAEPLGARPRPLLPHPQGRAAARRARAVRRLDLRHPPRPVAEPRDDAEAPVVRALRRLEAASARRLGREAPWRVHRRQRDSLQPAARRGLPRRSAASPARGRPRPTRRSAQAAGPAPTSSSAASTSEHTAEHKRVGMRKGFTLWFTGLSGAGKTTIAHIVGPELERRGHVVEYLDGDAVRTHLSKGLGFSKEDRDTNIERIGWVASRLTRQGGAVHRRRRSRRTRRRAQKARAHGRGVRHASSRSSSRPRSRSATRRDVEGPLREGAARRDQGASPASTIRTRSRRTRSS